MVMRRVLAVSWFLTNAHGVDPEPLPGREAGEHGFRVATPEESGLDFVNRLEGDAFLTNAVAHNGSGVALGDVDGDGLVDIYLCGLQNANALYRNLGDWKFERIDNRILECEGQFSTGAVFADVDGDGDPDLLVNGIGAGTRLFLNLGNWKWEELSDSGLSRTSSPTSMALADVDGDGDLDLYCTHYVDEMHIADPTVDYKVSRRNGRYVVTHVNGEPAVGRLADRFVVSESGELRELPERDGYYINEGGGRFRDIGGEAGIFHDSSGKPMDAPRDWGLAVASGDFNRDGLIDFYVCNDNASPDRVWLNMGGGRMQDAGARWFRHTSRSSMGVDVADFNGDGLEDLIVVDMLASDPARRMTQLVKQYSTPAEQINPNAVPRFNRNTLFAARPDAPYAEVALMAGVAATDWSWCPVFMDVDLDAFPDLLVTNGFSFDVMDQDSNDHIRNTRMSRFDRQRSRKLHPYYGSPNLSFRNNGHGGFTPMGDTWGFGADGISNGAACGDLDRDGDLDVVISRLNQPALLMENRSPAPRIAVSLTGRAPNTGAIGAVIRIERPDGGPVQSARIQSGGRYLSGDSGEKCFAAGGDLLTGAIMTIRWPSGAQSRLTGLRADHRYIIREEEMSVSPASNQSSGDQTFMDPLRLPNRWLPKLGEETGALEAVTSAPGPGVAAVDLDGNGWTDIVHAAGRGQAPLVLLNMEGKKFQAVAGLPAVEAPESAVVPWWDEQGVPHWIAAASAESSGAGNRSRLHVYSIAGSAKRTVLDAGEAGLGTLCVLDVDGDGDLDLFSGGVPVADRYPEPASSRIWIQEDRQLTFSEQWSRAFENVGIVRDAVAIDWDMNGTQDLVLAREAADIQIYLNDGNGFRLKSGDQVLESSRGYWSSIQVGDWNNDGQWDIVAGNRGLNTSLALHPGEKWRVSYLPGFGAARAVECVLRHGEWYPCTDRTNLSRAFPAVSRAASSHAGYGLMSVRELLGSMENDLKHLTIDCLESSLFLSGPGGMNRVALPAMAQWAPVTGLATADFDLDGVPDLFVAQNDFSEGSRVTRGDAGSGLILRGSPAAPFSEVFSGTGILIPGEMRGAVSLDVNRDAGPDLLVAAIGSPSALYLRRPSPTVHSKSLEIRGPEANPAAFGFCYRLSGTDSQPRVWIPVNDTAGPLSGGVPVLSLPASGGLPAAIEVRHPGGEIRRFPVSGDDMGRIRILWRDR